MSCTKIVHLVTVDSEDYSVISEHDGSACLSFKLISNPVATESDMSPILPHNLVVVDSVKSGKGRTAQNDFYNVVMEPIFRKLHIKHTLIKTTSRDSISSYAKSIDVNQSHTCLFLSGDTSISEFINNLPEGSENPDLRIIPFPMGSGNAWASSLGLSSAADTLGEFLRGSLEARSFPLYKAVFPNGYSIVFFIVLSLGFHANMLHACEEPKYKRMGNERFKEAGTAILRDYDLDLDITVDNYSKSYAYFLLINTPNLEPNYRPSPKSDPLKEELHILGYSSKLDKQQLLAKILQGYKMQSNEELLVDENVTYRPLTSNFDVILNYSTKESPSYKFEVCCDGLLVNMLDFQVQGEPNIIHIQFLHDYSAFNLKVMSPG